MAWRVLCCAEEYLKSRAGLPFEKKSGAKMASAGASRSSDRKKNVQQNYGAGGKTLFLYRL